MNKRFVKAAVAVSALVFGANSAYAATAQADARATILAPLSVTKTADLDFGTIANNNGGVVAINAATGAFDCAGGSGDLICAGTNGRATFTIAGQANAAVLTSVDPTVTLTGPSGTMSASLTSSGSAALDGTGAGSLAVGGALTVGPAQAAGAYVGTFNVSVVYN